VSIKKEVKILGWLGNRKKWNREGHCARQACQSPHDGWTQGNGLKYCEACKESIESHDRDGVIEWSRS